MNERNELAPPDPLRPEVERLTKERARLAKDIIGYLDSVFGLALRPEHACKIQTLLGVTPNYRPQPIASALDNRPEPISAEARAAAADAERDALKAEKERLKQERDAATEEMRKHWIANGTLEAEVSALKGEIERLKEELGDCQQEQREDEQGYSQTIRDLNASLASLTTALWAVVQEWSKQLEEGDNWKRGQPCSLSSDELGQLSVCHDQLRDTLDRLCVPHGRGHDEQKNDQARMDTQ